MGYGGYAVPSDHHTELYALEWAPIACLIA